MLDCTLSFACKQPQSAADIPATCMARVEPQCTVDDCDHRSDVLPEPAEGKCRVSQCPGVVAGHAQRTMTKIHALPAVRIWILARSVCAEAEAADRSKTQSRPIVWIEANRRLKQDIIDQDSALKPELLRNMSFFEPEVSDEAFLAFEHYVSLKWPLRVYAIEPVIAQQNVADAFYRSKRSVMELVGAAPIGPWRALAGLAAGFKRTAVRILILTAATGVICITVFPGGFSLWPLIYRIIPTASAIRAVARGGVLLLIPTALGVMFSVEWLTVIVPRRG